MSYKMAEDVNMYEFAKRLAKNLPRYHYFLIDRQSKAVSDYIRNDEVELFKKIVRGEAKADDFEYTHF
jgi:hypothetical protein